MPANRMNREEFFAKLAPLDEAALQRRCGTSTGGVRPRSGSASRVSSNRPRRPAASAPRRSRLILGWC